MQTANTSEERIGYIIFCVFCLVIGFSVCKLSQYYNHRDLIFSQNYLEKRFIEEYIIAPEEAVIGFCVEQGEGGLYVHLYEETFQDEIKKSVFLQDHLSTEEYQKMQKEIDILYERERREIKEGYQILKEQTQKEGKTFTPRDYCRFLDEHAEFLIAQRKELYQRKNQFLNY